MRLDHLLSREERSKELLSIVQGSRQRKSRGQSTKGEQVHLARLKKTSPSAVNEPSSRLEKTSPRTQAFWWRCVQGQHPFPSRTRWLRPERPMVLHWRRCGRVGGRQFKKRKTEAEPLPKLKINTGMGGQQSAGPTQPAGQCCENWFHQ